MAQHPHLATQFLNIALQFVHATIDIGHFRAGRHVEEASSALAGLSQLQPALRRGAEKPLLHFSEITGTIELHQGSIKDAVPQIEGFTGTFHFLPTLSPRSYLSLKAL